MAKDYSVSSNNNYKQNISTLFADKRSLENEWYDDLRLRELLIEHIVGATVSYAVSSVEEFKAELIEVRNGDLGNYVIQLCCTNNKS